MKHSAASILKLGAPKVQPVESEGGGRPVFQITEGMEASAGNNSESLRYSFTTPQGYHQIIDPATNTTSGTFISEGSNREYMTLRGRKTVIEATAENIRKQIEWLEQELIKLDRQRHEMDTRLAAMEEKDRSEFTVTVGERRDVEELPMRDEELQEMSRLVEGLGQSALPHGGDYAVLHTGEFRRKAGGCDPSSWLGWEMHMQSGQNNVAIIMLRRKYIPDNGFSFQDFVLTFQEFRQVDPRMYSPEAFFGVLRGVADSITPVPTKKNPLEFDRIDIIGHLEKLQGDEGYMSFFQSRFEPPDNRPSMSDKADEFVEALSSVLGPGGGTAIARKSSVWSDNDIFEDTIEEGFSSSPLLSPSAGPEQPPSEKLEQLPEQLEHAWQLLRDMTSNDDLNGLLVEQAHEYFFLQTNEGPLSPEEEASREKKTHELKHEWSQRVARCSHPFAPCPILHRIALFPDTREACHMYCVASWCLARVVHRCSSLSATTRPRSFRQGGCSCAGHVFPAV